MACRQAFARHDSCVGEDSMALRIQGLGVGGAGPRVRGGLLGHHARTLPPFCWKHGAAAPELRPPPAKRREGHSAGAWYSGVRGESKVVSGWVKDAGCRVYSAGLRVPGLRIWVEGSGNTRLWRGL